MARTTTARRFDEPPTSLYKLGVCAPMLSLQHDFAQGNGEAQGRNTKATPAAPRTLERARQNGRTPQNAQGRVRCDPSRATQAPLAANNANRASTPARKANKRPATRSCGARTPSWRANTEPTRRRRGRARTHAVEGRQAEGAIASRDFAANAPRSTIRRGRRGPEIGIGHRCESVRGTASACRKARRSPISVMVGARKAMSAINSATFSKTALEL